MIVVTALNLESRLLAGATVTTKCLGTEVETKLTNMFGVALLLDTNLCDEIIVECDGYAPYRVNGVFKDNQRFEVTLLPEPSPFDIEAHPTIFERAAKFVSRLVR